MVRSSCLLIAFCAVAWAGQATAGQSTSIRSWDHDARMRFFSWMVIGDAGKPCDRVIAVREFGYGVSATCVSQVRGKRKIHHYRVDQLRMKADFSQRWDRAIGR